MGNTLLSARGKVTGSRVSGSDLALQKIIDAMSEAWRNKLFVGEFKSYPVMDKLFCKSDWSRMNKGILSKTDIIKRAFAVVALMGALIVPSAYAAKDLSILPDPLKAGWKGSSVCEKLHEDKEKKGASMHVCADHRA